MSCAETWKQIGMGKVVTPAGTNATPSDVAVSHGWLSGPGNAAGVGEELIFKIISKYSKRRSHVWIMALILAEQTSRISFK